MRALLRFFAIGVLLTLALAVCAGCTSAPAAQPVATAAPVATQPAASQPTAAAAAQDSQDPGASLALNPAAADTRHFKGNPNASIVLIEISDFQ